MTTCKTCGKDKLCDEYWGICEDCSNRYRAKPKPFTIDKIKTCWICKKRFKKVGDYQWRPNCKHYPHQTFDYRDDHK